MVGVWGTCFVVVIGLAVIIGSIMITTAGEPELYINSHYDGETVNAEKITVYGHARGTDGAVIELVTVNGVRATGDTEWSTEVSLHPGKNTVTVVATDDIGNSATRTITVIPPGVPELYIDSYYDGETVNSEKITVYGHVRGTGGAVVELVTVNGVKATGDTEWSAEVSLHPGKNTITVVATDDIGNSAIKTITVIYETGAISVVSKPSGATIELETPDDSFVNIKTPHNFTNITPGTCRIKLFHEGYHDWSDDVEVMSGETTYVHASMITKPPPPPSPSPTISPSPTPPPSPSPTISPSPTPPPSPSPTISPTPIKSGNISVSSSPTGASVYLDNIYKGLTHCTITDVRQGDHNLKLSLAGYQDWSDTVHVSAEETTPVNAILTPETICEEGYKDCYPPPGDCETNIYEDNDNCGDCGKKCPDGYFCLKGWCVENTTENKKKLVTYYYEEGKRHCAEKRYEEALHYLRNARDVCNDLNMDEICGIIEVYIKEIRKKIIIIEIIHLSVEVGIAVILAAFFGCLFDKYRRPKKVPLLVVVAGSVGVFIVAFCALKWWVIPMFY